MEVTIFARVPIIPYDDKLESICKLKVHLDRWELKEENKEYQLKVLFML